MMKRNNHKDFNPKMLVLGRESRGFSQKELAAKLNVTQSRISKIEMGLLPITEDLLGSISRILDYPSSFFYQEGSLLGVGIAEIFHRKHQDISKRELNKIYAQIEIRVRNISELMHSVDIPCKVRRFDIDSYNGKVEDIARIVRASWNLPKGPIADITKILEDEGILVIPFEFNTRLVDAISRWIPGIPPLIFINSRSSKDRLRFSLAHELGHIIMHELPNPEIEEEANRFAAEFLLPEYEISADLYDINLTKLAVLKKYWKVSMAAILKTSQDLKSISDNQARYIWSQMSKAGYRNYEPIELDAEGEEPSLFKDIVTAHIDDLGYSLSELSTVLCLTEEEIWIDFLHGRSEPPLKLIQRKENLERA